MIKLLAEMYFSHILKLERRVEPKRRESGIPIDEFALNPSLCTNTNIAISWWADQIIISVLWQCFARNGMLYVVNLHAHVNYQWGMYLHIYSCLIWYVWVAQSMPPMEIHFIIPRKDNANMNLLNVIIQIEHDIILSFFSLVDNIRPSWLTDSYTASQSEAMLETCCQLTQILTVSLTHWGRDKMAAIFHTTFSNGFSWMKLFKFRLRFHWSLFPRVQIIIFQHWFRYWLGAGQATSHYLNQWWLVYWRIYASFGLNELRPVSNMVAKGFSNCKTCNPSRVIYGSKCVI